MNEADSSDLPFWERPETVERYVQRFGLDQPWYVQFFRYIWNALRGDFGYSQLNKAPVFVLVNQRAANTLMLAIASLIVAWGFSIPAGVISATSTRVLRPKLVVPRKPLR